MNRLLVISALVVAIGQANLPLADAQVVVTSEGLYKGEQIVNMAKELLADALQFATGAAQGAVAKGKSALARIGNNDALMEKLGERGFEFDMSDLIDKSLLEHLKDADSLEGVYTALEDAIEDHCYLGEFEPSEKVNSLCKGPEIELEMKPKTCYIDASGHSIDCQPAKLVMKKKPAKCTYKHHSSAKYKGHWCAIEKLHGVATKVEKGGDTYVTVIDGFNKDVAGHNFWWGLKKTEA